jgi:tetratricopeptide (TPR) repeat protein
MRPRPSIALVALFICNSPAFAADQLKFGPAPAWVSPSPIPETSNAPAEAPFATLLIDQQVKFENGKSSAYTETAVKIQTGEGLGLGNISLPWDPATDTVTIHKLHILRGKQVIDVLANGQSFTTMRREANLELAALDGRLTANIQPEGLQVGDVIDLAATVEHSDPVLKDHVEDMFAAWNGVPIKAARARIIWPENKKVAFRKTDSLPPVRRTSANGINTIELSLDNVEPLIPPKFAPLRFAVGRVAEASDFASWSEVAGTLIPFFQQAAVILKSGALRDEVERIRSQNRDQRSRTQQALALVQDRVRYVALLMGDGGYIPASAETTWSRRFGDCKAKTALLLAMLREFGVEAEPVLVNASAGDTLAGRLPMLGLFNHVLVRARLDGRTYWLDGTRTGDANLDEIDVPNFRWALPLVAGAKLIPLVPPPMSRPNIETVVTIDARAGLYAAAPMTATRSLRGDLATMLQSTLARLSSAQSDQVMREYWVNDYKYVTVKSATYSYDKLKSELRLSMTGEAKLDWNDGWFRVPEASIGYEPNLERAAGPDRDAPVAVDYPLFNRAHVEIRLPRGLAVTPKATPQSVKTTLLGVEYSRLVSRTGDLLVLDKSERAVVPEISYKQALADKPGLKAISDEDVYLRVPANYTATTKDLDARQEEKPSSSKAYFERGMMLLRYARFDAAISDLNEVIKAEPGNAWALANRGVAYVWKGQLEAAEKDFAAASAVDPDNSAVHGGRALLAEHSGKYQVAVDAFSKAIAKNPSDSFALYHRAAAYHRLGENDKAIADTESALKAGYKAPDIRLMRANIFRGRGNPELANREADALIAENPEVTFALVAAARIYAAGDLRKKAMDAFELALAVKPEPYIYVNRAEVRPASDEAGRMADLEAALRLEPGNPAALAAKASMLQKKGRSAEAVALYDQLLKTNPGEVGNQFKAMRAVAVYRTGKVADAKSAFDELRTTSKDPANLNNLCWTKATENILLESALDDCREALKQAPDDGAILDSLGMALLRLGRLDEALEAYGKAIAKRTGAASFMGRAMVYAAKGDKAKASADAAEARKLDPDVDTEFAGYGLKLQAAAGQ